MLAAYHETTGGLDVLRHGQVDDPGPLGAHDVLVRVRATSIDRVDVYWREGSHGMRIRQVPHIGGRDVAGVVEAVGSAVTTVRPGDAVIGSGWRTHAELAVTTETLTLPKPASLGWTAAGVIPTAGRSAHAALFDQARLQPGETVLVTAAASGVGSFGVMLAKARGCRVVATARPHPDVDKLAGALAIGADVALDSSRPDLAAAVLDATYGAGVDVVLDHVGTPLWPAVFEVLRPWGRYVTTGVTAGHRVELHLGQVFVKGLSIMGVGRPTDEQIRATLADLVAQCGDGRVTPPVHVALALSRVAEAHDLLERSAFFGKVALVPDAFAGTGAGTT